MDKRRRLLRIRLFLGVAVGMTGLTLVAYAFHFGFFEGLERQSIDMRFSLRGSEGTPNNIVVVKIDDVTFSEINRRWPFNRALHAQLIRRICSAQPKAIAIDIQFSELASVAEDNALYLALKSCPNKVLLGTTEVLGNTGVPHLIFPPDVLKAMKVRAGNANFSTDNAQVIRRMPFEIQNLKSFSLEGAEIATGKTITKGDMGGSSQWIDFVGPPDTFKAYHYSRVLPLHVVRRPDGKNDRKPWKVQTFGAEPSTHIAAAATQIQARRLARLDQVPADTFHNKIVVVGATAPTLQEVADIHATSTGSNMAGPELQANAIDTAMRGFPLRSLGTAWDVLLIIALGFVVPVASLWLRPMMAVLTGLVFAGIFIPGTLIGAFQAGRIASFVYPLTALILSTVGAIVIHYLVTAFEKERTRDVFARFVPEAVVDQVLATADDELRLGGREVVGTVMFSDLRGFTSSAEFMPADKVITVLNHYLHEMSEAILRHGGTLLCYMGDGIYALFGAPIDQDDHADRALAASREMLTERLPAFNDFMQEVGLGEGYFMGVGLNTGPVMTGNVGHERRMDYTAVGDIVNTASRIEGMTKGTPYSVLIAESTIESLQSPPGDIVFFEEQEVRGRKEKLKLYALDIKKPDGASGPIAAKAKENEAKSESLPEAAEGSIPSPAPAGGS